MVHWQPLSATQKGTFGFPKFSLNAKFKSHETTSYLSVKHDNPLEAGEFSGRKYSVLSPCKKMVWCYYLLNRYSLPMKITSPSISTPVTEWKGNQEFCSKTIQGVIWKWSMFTGWDTILFGRISSIIYVNISANLSLEVGKGIPNYRTEKLESKKTFNALFHLKDH